MKLRQELRLIGRQDACCKHGTNVVVEPVNPIGVILPTSSGSAADRARQTDITSDPIPGAGLTDITGITTDGTRLYVADSGSIKSVNHPAE